MIRGHTVHMERSRKKPQSRDNHRQKVHIMSQHMGIAEGVV